jgi:integrase
MAYLFRRERQFLAPHGFDAVAHVPFLLNGDMSYADEANRFLRERALLDWHPHNRHGEPTAKVRVPAENTMFAMARDMENFLSYAESNGFDWRGMDYQQVLRTYQADQLNGSWSERGEPLAPATINRRVGTVCEFLMWAGDRELRSTFQVMGSRSTVRDRSGTATTNRFHAVTGRAGRVRERVERLRIPTVAEIDAWLAEIEGKRGKTKALACRTILETGMRLEEVALLRAAQVPDPGAVLPGYPARMDICYGTKGSRQVGDPDKKGKARTLRFGVGFLHALDDYRRLRRAKALAAFRRAHPGERLPETLFLAEDGGQPLTKKMIYDAWTRCQTLPFPGWSPHAGRHAFACLLLLRLIHEEGERIGQAAATLPRTALIGQASDLVQTYVRPVLGHVSEETTARYLEWVADHFLVAEHRAAWAHYLEGGNG